MTPMLYLIIGVTVWTATLAWYMHNEAPPEADLVDWTAGSGIGLLAGLFWPLAILALIPVAIVKYLKARTGQ